MSGSPAKARLRAAATVIAALAALAAFGVAAEELGAPTPIDPMGATPLPAPPSVPTPPAEPDQGGEAPLKAIGSRPGMSEPVVEVGTLGVPDTALLGLLPEGGGGLAATMWRGTSRVEAQRLLSELPVATHSRALQELVRRTLLTQAEPPEGRAPGPSLLSLRLAKLLEMGDFASVLKLSESVPVAAGHDGEQRARAEALLFRGSADDACGLGRTMRLFAGDPYWAKLGAFCDVRAGDPAAGDLAVTLLQERGVDLGSFLPLYEALAGRGAAETPLPDPDGSGLAFAMTLALGRDLAAWPGARTRPAYLHALALSTGGRNEDRLSLAEQAAAFGALPARELGAIYALQTFSPVELADAKAAAASLPPARGTALLIAAAQADPAPAKRIDYALAALRHGRAAGLEPVLMDILGPLLQAIPPSRDLSWAAADLAEAYLLAGAPEQAIAWHGMINRRQEQAGDPRRLDRLANLLRIATPDPRFALNAGDLRRLIKHAKALGAPALNRLAFELGLVQSLGTLIEPELLEDVPALPLAPDTPALLRFKAAAAAQRVAEAALLVPVALGPEGPAKAPAATVVVVVRGLNALGLGQPARAIALEAALNRP